MRSVMIAGALCLCCAAAPAGQTRTSPGKAPAKAAKAKAAAPKAGEIVVTATYKGQGAVDPAHEILVFLFPNPNPDAAPPVAVQPVTKNGGTATFTNVTTSPVYVAAVYNEKGDYHGSGGPPPSGAPYTLHADAKGTMLPVKADAGASVMLLFDGSKRR